MSFNVERVRKRDDDRQSSLYLRKTIQLYIHHRILGAGIGTDYAVIVNEHIDV